MHLLLYSRGLNKEELELYTEMKARRDAEDEAKRATESSDEEVVMIMRMRTAFVCMYETKIPHSCKRNTRPREPLSLLMRRCEYDDDDEDAGCD